MERTKEYSVVNDTLKALKNQGLSERYFQKGHSFSSAPRYDHFDTSPFSMAAETCRRHIAKFPQLVYYIRLCDKRKALN